MPEGNVPVYIHLYIRNKQEKKYMSIFLKNKKCPQKSKYFDIFQLRSTLKKSLNFKKKKFKIKNPMGFSIQTAIFFSLSLFKTSTLRRMLIAFRGSIKFISFSCKSIIGYRRKRHNELENHVWNGTFRLNGSTLISAAKLQMKIN